MERYGQLTIIKEVESLYNKKVRRFLCICDCGIEKIINLTNLNNGSTKSCGCLLKQLSKERRTTHGMSGTRTQRSWKSMIQRCTNPKNNRWKHYGGRGITVCERWMKFENFLADMGERPEGTTLDRIDPNGNYEPGNCRWADNITQANNKRKRGHKTN